MRGARSLEPEEIQAILSAFDGKYRERNRAIFVLSLKTGARASQVLGLRINDVFDGERFLSSVCFTRRIMKGKRRGHALPLHPKAKRAVGRWLVELRKQRGTLPLRGWLFPSREGGRQLSFNRYWEVLREAAQRARCAGRVSTHSPRKTLAGAVYRKHGIVRAGAILGHFNADGSVDVVATSRYLPAETDEDIRATLFAI